LLDLRKAELGISKVSSHLEAIGAQPVEAEFAFICDIIGNALADESAAIAAEWLEPKKAQCNEAEAIDNLAFMICIRLAFTQARIWEVTADSLLYEAPPEPEEVDLDLLSNFQNAADELAAKGHWLEAATRGETAGHTCTRCTKFKKKTKFNDWLTGPPCLVQATGKQRKEIIEIEFNTKAKAQTREREANINYDSSPETSLPKKARPA